MPAKINMYISNGHPTVSQIKAFQKSMSVPTTRPPSALNASMISRIHNVRPGCGSCGRG